MRKLYRFHWDCGRKGEVDGVFAAEEADVKAAIGRQVYFGEILGKHSEICGTLEEDDLIPVTSDEDFISKAEKYGLLPTGHNPLKHLEE